ncbi:hypothetical protein ACHAQA_003301 [Verticillium albo-atrum]
MKFSAVLLQAIGISNVLALRGHVGWLDFNLDVGRINGDNGNEYLYIGASTLKPGETGPLEQGQLVEFKSRRILATNVAFEIDIVDSDDP